MVIGRAECEGDTDSTAKASVTELSSAGLCRGRKRPHRDFRQKKAHYKCETLLAPSWHCEMRFSPHMSALSPKFHYLYLQFGSNRALLPALDICHAARVVVIAPHQAWSAVPRKISWRLLAVHPELLVSALLVFWQQACVSVSEGPEKGLSPPSLQHVFTFRPGPLHSVLKVP